MNLPLKVEGHRVHKGAYEVVYEYLILDAAERVIAWTTDRRTGQELVDLVNLRKEEEVHG